MWYLLREGFDAYGIDISEFAIERTKEFLTKEHLSVEKLAVGDVRSLPYAENTFNVVVDSCTTQQNQPCDFAIILSEYKRVLNLGGIYFTIWRDKDSWIQPNQPFTVCLTEKELIDLISPYFNIIALNYSQFSLGYHAETYIRHHILVAQKIN